MDAWPMEARCVIWNAEHSIGTEAEYYPVLGRPEFRLPRTRSAAGA
jgi:hypothetical protein